MNNQIPNYSRYIGKDVTLIPEAVFYEKVTYEKEDVKNRILYEVKSKFDFYGKSVEDITLIADENNLLEYYSSLFKEQSTKNYMKVLKKNMVAIKLLYSLPIKKL